MKQKKSIADYLKVIYNLSKKKEGSPDSRNRGYGGIQGVSVPYQGFLHWDAARTARLFVCGAVTDDVLA